MRSTKQRSRKAAVLAADKYASLDVRLDGACVLCGKRSNLNCGHLFSRVAYSIRWDEANLYCLCAGCNIAMENDPSVGRNLLEHAESVWGEDMIAQLHFTYKQARPVKTYEIEEAAECWKAKYRKHCAWRGIEATA